MSAFDRCHPAVLAKRAQLHPDIVAEVAAAVARDPVVVVGMAWNPVVKRARRILRDAELAHTYLEYGSYFSGWKRRLALKLWVGWPTFPMIFVKGTFIGGASDLQALRSSGELKTLLQA